MEKTLLLFAAISLLSLNLAAQKKYLKDIPQTQELSKKIGDLFNDRKISESFDELSIYWPLPQDEIDGLEEKTVKYLNLLSDRFGKTQGAIKVKNETISDIATRETYIVRYEKSAIRLIFTYYKNDNGWIVNAFKWDDSFTEEFK
jgi:hypothetical protein